jgi:hypothetical protein
MNVAFYLTVLYGLRNSDWFWTKQNICDYLSLSQFGLHKLWVLFEQNPFRNFSGRWNKTFKMVSIAIETSILLLHQLMGPLQLLLDPLHH